jgi:hypothetical protein
MSYITVAGTKLVDGDQQEIILRGAGLGGWMKCVAATLSFSSFLTVYSMENFISGYPGCEFQIREALADTVGQQKSELFFDKVRRSAGALTSGDNASNSFSNTFSRMPMHSTSRAWASTVSGSHLIIAISRVRMPPKLSC